MKYQRISATDRPQQDEPLSRKAAKGAAQTSNAPDIPGKTHPVLALQQRIGNQAVQRLLKANQTATPAPATQIQRYAKIPVKKQKDGNWQGLGVALRVSDDGKMATPDSEVFQGSKNLYATTDVITDAHNKLSNLTTRYDVEQGNNTLQGIKPDESGKNAVVRTLYQIVPVDTTKQDIDPTKRGEAIKTLEACSAHGLDFMNVKAGLPGKMGKTRKARIDVGSDNSVVNIGNSSAESDMEGRDKIVLAIARMELKLQDDAPNPAMSEARKIYNKLSEKKRSEYAQIFGINQFASPEVGDGIEAIRTGGTKDDGFPMHFAPVIAKTGEDYATLENYAKNNDQRKNGDTQDASNDWYFRMYGPYKEKFFGDDDQSYYGEHAKEGDIGGRKDTMGLTNTNAPN